MLESWKAQHFSIITWLWIPLVEDRLGKLNWPECSRCESICCKSRGDCDGMCFVIKIGLYGECVGPDAYSHMNKSAVCS